jgi:hypothetical protein
MKKFCYDKCYSFSKIIYDCFIFLSFRTKPLLHPEDNNNIFLNKPVNYCKLCDLDDFRIESNIDQHGTKLDIES